MEGDCAFNKVCSLFLHRHGKFVGFQMLAEDTAVDGGQCFFTWKAECKHGKVPLEETKTIILLFSKTHYKSIYTCNLTLCKDTNWLDRVTSMFYIKYIYNLLDRNYKELQLARKVYGTKNDCFR